MFEPKIFLPPHPESGSSRWSTFKGYSNYEDLTRSSILFEDTFFDLNKTSLWNETQKFHQKEILQTLSENIVSEALQIEMAGMVYASKMSLLSKTIDERQMYCEFSSQEARHFESLHPYLTNREKLQQTTDFSEFVASIVRKTDYLEGLLLVQTVLEGWGLSYYKELMIGTKSQPLAKALTQIIKDEVKHHSSGVHSINGLLGHKHFENSDFSQKVLFDMMQSIAIGPVSLVKEAFIYSKCPRLEDVRVFIKEIRAFESSLAKMNQFLEILSKVVESKILKKWEGQNRFAIFTEDQMAEYIFSQINTVKSPELNQNPPIDYSL